MTATQNVTEVVIKAACINPGCQKDLIWRSQPVVPGTKTAAGKFLPHMSTLFSGGSLYQSGADLSAHGIVMHITEYVLHPPTGEL